MNNDFLRHGKECPAGDVSSMVTWLLKRHGGNNTNYREDAATDGVTSFAQVRSKSRMKCVACGKQGHLAWDCYSITPAKRADYRQWQSACTSDDSSVGSNNSSRSETSHASIESGSSGSASRCHRREAGRDTPPLGRSVGEVF